jgi:hypothetical protein
MRSASSRAGFSLMEVLMATSILLASVIVLGELAGMGRRQASAARELATAQLLCENKIGEMLAGAAPIAEADSEPIEEHPGWIYSVKLEPVKQLGPSAPPGMVALKVTVAPEEAERQRTDAERHAAKEYSLVRWIRDPAAAREDRTPPATAEVARRTRPSGAGPLR